MVLPKPFNWKGQTGLKLGEVQHNISHSLGLQKSSQWRFLIGFLRELELLNRGPDGHNVDSVSALWNGMLCCVHDLELHGVAQGRKTFAHDTAQALIALGKEVFPKSFWLRLV